MENKWSDYKQYEGLIWKVHNYNLFSFKPDDDDIVQSVFYLKLAGNRSYVSFQEIGMKKPDIIFEGTEESCKEHWEGLCDARMDPKMLCTASFRIN